MTQLTIKAKARCVSPSLISVERLSNDTLKFTWDNNNVDYFGGTIGLQYSANNGASWNTLVSVSPSSSPYTVTSPILTTLLNGSAIQYRILGNSNACTNLISNVINSIWYTGTLINGGDYSIVLDNYSCSVGGNGVNCGGSGTYNFSTVFSNTTGVLKITVYDDDTKPMGDGSSTMTLSINATGNIPINSQFEVFANYYSNEPYYGGSQPEADFVIARTYQLQHSIDGGLSWGQPIILNVYSS